MNNYSSVNNTKKIYSSYNALSTHGFSDSEIISNLLNILQTPNFKVNVKFQTLISNLYTDKTPHYINIVELLGLTLQKSKEKQTISNTNLRKHHGIYYTNYHIAKRIAEDVIALFGTEFNPTKLTFLEPCSGIGIFALAYLDAIFERNRIFLKSAQTIVAHMFFADIDEEAIILLKKIIPSYLKLTYGLDVKIPQQNIYVGDVLFTVNDDKVVKNNLKSIFNMYNGFDIVLTNPPYKLLKANSDKYNASSNYKVDVTSILKFIRKNHIYHYNAGTLNLYKIFIEEILENYTHQDSKVGLLIPSTLLSDKHSFDLRKRILEEYSLSTIYTIPEKNNFFLDITQAFCFFALDKRATNTKFSLKANIVDIPDLSNETVHMSKTRIDTISSFKEIVSTDHMGWKILSQLHKNKKLKEIHSITNSRGELDLTLDKKFITDKVTNYKLLRGNGIKEFSFIEDTVFVQDSFINKLNGKARYLSSERIVCQQISNLNLKKRLKFSKVPKNIVLGNSCNFIVTNNDSLFSEYSISLDYLLGLLNSFLLNWRFQLTSSNNHIGNYQLDELPIAMPNPKEKLMTEDLTDKLLKDPNNEEYKVKLNSLVFNIYKLTNQEILYILDNYQDKTAELTKQRLHL